MIRFFIFLVLAVLALVLFGASFAASKTADHPGDPSPRTVTRVVAGFCLALGLFLFLSACVATVGTKNLGVITTFGRPSGYLDNGLHGKWPWQSITELNDATQTDTYASDENAPGKPQGGALGTCVHVRLSRQATGCANVSVRWQIKASGVDYLFRNYKDNTAIQDNLVLRNLQQDMNAAFSSYDPLAVDSQGRSTNKPLSSSDPSADTYSRQVEQEMRREIGEWIDVQDVVIPILNYDSQTQGKVNQLLQQVASTRIAQQSQLTATARARANQIIAASIDKNPAVNVANCLNLVEEALNKGLQGVLPPGFTCMGPSSTGLAISTARKAGA